MRGGASLCPSSCAPLLTHGWSHRVQDAGSLLAYTKHESMGKPDFRRMTGACPQPSSPRVVHELDWPPPHPRCHVLPAVTFAAASYIVTIVGSAIIIVKRKYQAAQ